MKPRSIAHLIIAFAVTLASLQAASPARAQSATTGAIAGIARDTTGAVLPGVTVEASSPALIEKVRTAVTDDQGNYKIVDLRPGTYTVTFTLTGFSTFKREELELTTGFTATVNGEMRVGSIEETVTVTGASPIVDVQNVRQHTVLSSQVLDTVPTGGKTIQAFASLIVGAVIPTNNQDVGGSSGENAVTVKIHGGRSTDQRLLQDGMRFNSMVGSGSSRGFLVNQVSVQEVTFELGTNSAEFDTGGIQINMVPKDGGNTFRLYARTEYTDNRLQNSNVTDALRARGLGLTAQTSIKRIWDYGVGLGGPLKQDTLWFYTAHRWWGSQEYQPGTYFNSTPHSMFYNPDLSRPAYTDVHNRDNNIRLTWQAASKHKIAGSWNIQDDCNCFYAVGTSQLAAGGGQGSGVRVPEATVDHRYNNPNSLVQGSWNHPATNKLLFEAGATLMAVTHSQNRTAGTTNSDIAINDTVKGILYNARGDNLTGSAYGGKSATQVNERASASYITGSHAFKAGMFMMEGWLNVHSEDAINQALSYTFLNNVPSSLAQWATPYAEKNTMMPTLGLYGQDQWKLNRMTLNLGLRFDYLRTYAAELHLDAGRWVPARDFPKLDNLPNWKDISPRLGVAYDVFGNGKTAVKAALGRYVVNEATGIVQAAAPTAAIVTSVTRTWNDANLNFVPDCVLTDLLANGECGQVNNLRFGTPVITRRFDPDITAGFGVRPYDWQASASLQHELHPGIGLTAGYFRTWYGNFTVTQNLAVTAADFNQYCVTAPADARLPGGGANQICGLYDVTPSKFGQVNSLVTKASIFGDQTEVYNGVDLTVNARFGRGGLLSGGVSTGKTVTDNCYQNARPDLLASGALTTTPRTDAYCRATLSWGAQSQVKFSGSYPLPWDLQASGAYQNIPGLARLAANVFTNAQVVPSLGRDLAAGSRGTVTVDLIEPNAAFEDRINQLDLRLTKSLRFGRTRLQGMFDVYNVLNAGPVLLMNTTYGPNWLKPTQILSARLFKFGAQVDW